MHSVMYPVPDLPVTDLDRARQFYEGVLGFKMEREDPGGGLLFKVGDGYLYVYKTEARRGENTQVTFMVRSFDDEVGELRGKNIRFEQYDMPGVSWDNGVATMEDGGMRSVWFTDPEGNILNITDMEMTDEIRKAA